MKDLTVRAFFGFVLLSYRKGYQKVRSIREDVGMLCGSHRHDLVGNEFKKGRSVETSLCESCRKDKERNSIRAEGRTIRTCP